MIKTFEFLINTGVQSLEMVADAEKKASICAELAKAIAMSGVLRATDIDDSIAPVEEKPETAGKQKKNSRSSKNAKKEALKTENQKEETVTPVEEPAAPQEPVEAPTQPIEEEPVETPSQPAEVEIVDEWTEEMQVLKAEQLGMLNNYVEAWGEEYVYNDCLGCFTENTLVGAENVRPSNIDGFVVYLNELAQQFSQQ